MTQGVAGTARYPHGTENCYVNNKCRRPECRQAATRARKIRRWKTRDQAVPMRVPAIGSLRRLQALMCNGWSLPRLEEKAGVREWYYRELIFQQLATLDRDRAKRISQLYDELWDQEPPCSNRFERQAVSHLKGIAKRAGYAPPMAWAGVDIDDPESQPRLHAEVDEGEIFDWVKVERVLEERMDARLLNQAEKAAAARILDKRGWLPSQIADFLHMGLDTVRRRLTEEQPLRMAA